MNAKDRVYNRRSREVSGVSQTGRMRSPSDEGWDNITHPERGPLAQVAYDAPRDLGVEPAQVSERVGTGRSSSSRSEWPAWQSSSPVGSSIPGAASTCCTSGSEPPLSSRRWRAPWGPEGADPSPRPREPTEGERGLSDIERKIHRRGDDR